MQVSEQDPNYKYIMDRINDRIQEFKQDPKVCAHIDSIAKEKGIEAAKQYAINNAIYTLYFSVEEREQHATQC